MLAKTARAMHRLTPSNAIFMECDIQVKLAPHIQLCNVVAHNAKRLCQTGQVLGVPIVATRHVQKNFGDISSTIGDVTHEGRVVFDKSLFSMLEPPVFEHM